MVKNTLKKTCYIAAALQYGRYTEVRTMLCCCSMDYGRYTEFKTTPFSSKQEMLTELTKEDDTLQHLLKKQDDQSKDRELKLSESISAINIKVS